ncbi:sulfite exporter TauE/SafE family protein [Albibacillus kandeliae]|uniref:sulfite exporter TauE/SafE family protein n=1 Tax=Albibacillus kandeliae TaxID=2174228 RepID=UPI000D69FCE8|nr:sulfite exporter TauE/SafE family protein [Albibacillus kandeliae]
MSSFLTFLSPVELGFAVLVVLVAGVVKGMVGFAMPMIMISGLSFFLPPELALAGLLFPTVATNGFQALRQGAAAAWESIVRFRLFLIVGGVLLLSSAQLVRVLEPDTLLVMIGGPVVFFAVIQLLGLRLRLSSRSAVVEGLVASVAGFVGGMSGIWGPPTVMYLTALDTPKDEQMRVQGVIYGLGAVMLVAAHIGSGVLTTATAPFSALMVVPALVGMWVGGRLQDRIDQATFRKATLAVLLIAGLNLLRRGLMG